MNRHAAAIACYLAIPVVLIGGVTLSVQIDPEWAHRTADYAGNYRLLERVQHGVILTAGALAIGLWLATCYLVIRSRQRSLGWMCLAAGGPLGFAVIASLDDRSPASDDFHQRFIGRLVQPARMALEIVVFVAIWVIAIGLMMSMGELLMLVDGIRTGASREQIMDLRNASSGMQSFGEALVVLYLVALLYLLRPLLFNLSARVFGHRAAAKAID